MQGDIRKLLEKYALSQDISVRLHDLASEVGELNKAYLKSTEYGTKEFILSNNFEEELGDVLFTLLSICELTGVDAKSVLELTKMKYERRYTENGHIGSK